ncbi:MAG: DUF4401 domain-containing protein [Chitinophagaceae bacterium]|nr:DUF4401 domain-containing protein [Chitinophagaceae bacterium]MCW5927340.1 DUF4401 domain-containing protein [Chitinophagaceae bacterium]
MRTPEEIKELLHSLKSGEETFEWKEEAILADYQKSSADRPGIVIKILSVLGGILATLTFLAFLFMAQIMQSPTSVLVLGLILVGGAVWLSKQYGRVFLDTLSVTTFISGLALTGFGLSENGLNANTISLLFILISLITLFIVRSYILSFICILVINGCIIQLLLSNYEYNLMYVYTSVMALAVTCIFLKEATLIRAGNLLSGLYDPLRSGLLISFIAGLAIFGGRRFWGFTTGYAWVTSIVIIAAILYLVSRLLKTLQVSGVRQQAIIYICCVPVLTPALFAPAILGSILIILLGFYVNYRTALVLGMIAFIYFVSQYYYDLHLTLLTKSIILFASGLLFLILYFFVHKKITTNEKI